MISAVGCTYAKSLCSKPVSERTSTPRYRNVIFEVGVLSRDLLAYLLPSRDDSILSFTWKHLPETNKNSIKDIDSSQSNTKLNSAEWNGSAHPRYHRQQNSITKQNKTDWNINWYRISGARKQWKHVLNRTQTELTISPAYQRFKLESGTNNGDRSHPPHSTYMLAGCVDTVILLILL